MTLKEDRIKSMEFRNPETIPVQLDVLPATWMKYRGELAAIASGKIDERVWEAALAIHQKQLEENMRTNEAWPDLLTEAVLNDVLLSELTMLKDKAKDLSREEFNAWTASVLKPGKVLSFALEP